MSRRGRTRTPQVQLGRRGFLGCAALFGVAGPLPRGVQRGRRQRRPPAARDQHPERPGLGHRVGRVRRVRRWFGRRGARRGCGRPGRRRGDPRRHRGRGHAAGTRASSRRSTRTAPTRAASSARRADGIMTCPLHGSQFTVEGENVVRSRTAGPPGSTANLAEIAGQGAGRQRRPGLTPVCRGYPARRVAAWPTRRRTAPPPGRSRPRRASTGSGTPGAGSSTSARPRTSAPRLTSYFQDLAGLHARTATMVTTAAGVEWTVVNTEVEALQLEYSWIKEFDPRFNVKYRDDKSYPWLAVTVGEEFPRVMVGRGAKKKGTRYFGPYSHAWAIRDTVDQLLRVFPMRSCCNGVFKRVRADRPAVPARLHRQVLGALRRPGHRRGAPRDRRGLLRLHGRADRRRSSSASRRRCTPPPRRWTSSGPPGSATTSGRSTGRWRSRRWCSATAPTPT